jgi:ABC-2 type transport system ATP-binding protein
MITGLLEPTRGEILFDGVSIRSDVVAYKRRLGYVPEEPNLYPHLTGLEYLDLIGCLRGLDSAAVSRKSNDLLELFSLHPARHTPIASYSKGMRQRVLISAALLHNPDIIVFDEPLSGLDVTSAVVFRKLVDQLSRQGKVILYSSHVLEVVEKVCTHVLVLHNGNVVGHGSIAELRDLTSKPSLEQVFAELTQQTDTDETARGIVDVISA